MTEEQLKKRLSEYKWDISRLSILEARIKESYASLGLKGITYDSPRLSESFKFNSSTENGAIKHMEEHSDLIKQFGKQELKVNEIKYALESLIDKEFKLITMKYIDKASWSEIALTIGHSFGTTRNMHQEIIKKMVHILNN
jgi:DNA-directed RNA polymerase specialized sigma subunit